MSSKNTGLISGLEQRRIGKTYGSIRGLLQLRTPSGPQQVESQLESDMVEQLNFSPHVRDLITQPIIKLDAGGPEATYACDIFFQLFPGAQNEPTFYLVEVKRAADLAANKVTYEKKFRGAEAWCAKNSAKFRVLTEHDIRTPYLANARRFIRYYNCFPEDRLLALIEEAVGHSSLSVASTIAELQARGVPYVDARLAIEKAVANWLIGCNLSKPFTDTSLLHEVNIEAAITGDNQPILKIIRDAKNL